MYCILMFRAFFVLCSMQGTVAGFLDQLVCARCMHDGIMLSQA